MSAQQHRYGSATVVTQSIARVESITYQPQQGTIYVEYHIGEEVSGSFTLNERTEILIQFDSLSGALQSVFDNLETKALNFGVNNNLFVSGAIETI